MKGVGLPDPFEASILINLLLEPHACVTLLGVLQMAFPECLPLTPDDALLGMVSGQCVGFMGERVDLRRQQSRFMSRVVSALPDLMATRQRITELPESCLIVVGGTRERIVPVE